MSIPFEAALDLLLQHTPVLGIQQVPLVDSLGRLLACDVYAPGSQPPFDRSPLDGYAVRAQDLAGAAPHSPAVLQVVDHLFAGSVSHIPVLAGQAVRLMTGSMIPKGADCVIRQEDTDEGTSAVRIFRSLSAGSNICRCGEEYRSGDLLLPAAARIDPAAIAVAAAAGFRQLPVRRRPRAAILSTGDELQRPGAPLPPGKIYDSNTAFLTACLRQLDVSITGTRFAGDSVEAICDALLSLADAADLVLTTGGVSVGQKDLMEAAILGIGGTVLFHGISMKPGMPTLLASRGETLFLCLSGNPFSAAVPFFLLFRPMLARMVQDPGLDLRQAFAKAETSFGKKSPTRRFLRGFYHDGFVTIPQAQGNGQMRSMVGCNCLIDIPAQTEAVFPGDTLQIFLL